MNAQELFKAGKLSEAVSALNATLRDNPSDSRSRTFLFELLCFAGDYERAEKQLNVLEQEGKKDSVFATLLYKTALNAEKTRLEMFRNDTFPKAAAAAVDTVRGKLNGKEFLSISDADPRIGSKLELFAAGDYMWISFRDISLIHVEAPKRLRDLFWIPAKVAFGPTFESRNLGEILLPALSPQSFEHPDDEVRLGRVSEWCEDEAGKVAPFGQKNLLVDGEEFPLLEVRELEIYPGEATAQVIQ